jgi:O-antigen/teichoic acid export membrane protein
MLRVTLLSLSLLALALGIAARPIVLIIFGEAFEPSVAPLIVALPGAIFLGLAKVATKYIDGVGRPGVSSTCTAAGLVVGGLALVPLTQRYGLVGAALASDLGYAAMGVGAVWAFARLSGEPLSHCLWPSWSDLQEVALRLRAASPLARRR